MKQSAVLALDLATTTGWAWHRPGEPRPFFDAVKLPGEARDLGQRGDCLERSLRQWWKMNQDIGGISHIFFEEQHVGAFKKKGRGGEPDTTRTLNPETIKLLAGLAMIAEKFAFQTGAKVYSVGIGEWRKHFIGRGAGFAKLGLNKKQMAIDQCARLGWHTHKADAAEALGILDYGLTMIPDYVRPWRDNALMGGMIK